MGRYIVGYTFGNHVLRLRSRVAVKLNFRPYIRRYTSPNENFEYSYPLIVGLDGRFIHCKSFTLALPSPYSSGSLRIMIWDGKFIHCQLFMTLPSWYPSGPISGIVGLVGDSIAFFPSSWSSMAETDLIQNKTISTFIDKSKSE